jgi:hypothetical protein
LLPCEVGLFCELGIIVALVCDLGVVDTGL